MNTRAYSICRRCASVYPEGRRCPACDNDHEAGRVVSAAMTHAVEVGARVRTRPIRGTALLVSAIVALSLIAGFGVLAVAMI